MADAIAFWASAAACAGVALPSTSVCSAFAIGDHTTAIAGMFGIGSPRFALAITAWVTGFDLTTFEFATEFSTGTRPAALNIASCMCWLRYLTRSHATAVFFDLE